MDFRSQRIGQNQSLGSNAIPGAQEVRSFL